MKLALVQSGKLLKVDPGSKQHTKYVEISKPGGTLRYDTIGYR